MNILYTLNEKYVPHLAASMCSLCENNTHADEITFHIVSMGLSDDSKKKITELSSKYGRNTVFYEIGDIRERLSDSIGQNGFDISVVARLFAGSILPDSINKVIYLDCDTIIIGDMLPFWNTNMNGCTIAAVAEPVVTKSRRPLLNMLPSHDYYNSGVIMFDLLKWREDGCEKIAIDYFFENSKILVATDQDVLNACFKGAIKTVAPKYNYGSYNIYYPYKLLRKLAGASPYVSEEIYNDSKKNPVIIHYLGEERPWRKGNTHPYTNEYKKYLSMTEWKDNPDETGWGLYFFCFRIFNFVTKPFPNLRFKIIDSLIPSFMRYRQKKIKKELKKNS